MPNDKNIPQTDSRFDAWRRALGGCYRTANAVLGPVLSILLKTVLVFYFLFCLTVLGLRYVVLPNIDNYKPQVEQMVTRALGNKVAIGDIDASWSGLHPRLSLDKVVIYDKEGNPALTLPQVSATLSWWSVVARELSLYQLEIIRPDMDIRRDADGRLYVAGIYIDTEKAAMQKGRTGCCRSARS